MRMRWMTIVAMTALLVAACGGGDGDTAEATADADDPSTTEVASDGDGGGSSDAIEVETGEFSFVVELDDGSRYAADQIFCATNADSDLVVNASIIADAPDLVSMFLGLGMESYLSVDGAIDDPVYLSYLTDELQFEQRADGTIAGTAIFGADSSRAGQTATVSGWCPP